jgi:spermidine synthase
MSKLTFPIRSDKLQYEVAYKNHVSYLKTDFQQIDIYDTYAFGKVLLLDGHVQLAVLDEHCYHEALVHPVALSLSEAKRALIVGGGDGGALRELVKHKNLETIEMVEIDEGVVETCKLHLPEVSAGAFEDERVVLHIADAFGFLKNVETPYDIIVMDVTDVYEEDDESLSESLFGDDFHRDVCNALSESGFLVTQADNLVFCPYSMNGILTMLEKYFNNVGSYWALVPSFGGFSGFAWASHNSTLANSLPKNDLNLRYLSPTTYQLGLGPAPAVAPYEPLHSIDEV